VFIRLLLNIREITVSIYRGGLNDDSSGVSVESLKLAEFVVGVDSGRLDSGSVITTPVEGVSRSYPLLLKSTSVRTIYGTIVSISASLSNAFNISADPCCPRDSLYRSWRLRELSSVRWI
jgi:hypothetical protein